MYFPNVDVTWNGTAANTHTTCSMVTANTLTMSGGAYMSTQNCAKNTIVKPKSSLWCSDEKPRSARRRRAGVLPRRRAAFHIDVRHLRSRTLCNHDAVPEGARECRRDGAIMINCYTPDVVGNTSPSSCTGDYLSVAQSKLLPRPCMVAALRLQ